MKFLASIIALFLIPAIGLPTLHAQYLVSSQSLGTRSKAELESQIGHTVRTGVSLYKILYMTTNVHGATDTASGLLVYPDMSIHDAQPIVVYQHGTTNGPNDVPSRLTSGSDEALAYGAMGYVTLAADYLGLGDNPGFHPYVHAASEASVALDLLFAVAEWIEVTTGEGWIGDLFISGYSQGGHAAAALQKELEHNWGLVFPVTASTLMSGPYSLSGVMFDRIISDEIYYTPAYVAYIVLAYQEAYGTLYTDLSDIFKSSYVPIIENFYSHNITTSLLNFFLTGQLINDITVSKPKFMFKDSVLQEIISNENHPLRVALRDNDLYDWTPQAPTRLYYCTADEQVPFKNSIVADSVMQSNGAPDLAAINFGDFTHGGCAPLAIEASISFFDSFLLPNSVRTLHSDLEAAIVSNPVTSSFHLQPGFDGASEFTVIDMNGVIVKHFSDITKADVTTFSQGVYILQVTQNQTRYRQKVVILN